MRPERIHSTQKPVKRKHLPLLKPGESLLGLRVEKGADKAKAASLRFSPEKESARDRLWHERMHAELVTETMNRSRLAEGRNTQY